MKVKVNHVGKIAGIYEIIELMPYKSNDGHAMYKGKCVYCGAERIDKYNNLLKDAKSCHHFRLGTNNSTKMTKWRNRRIGHIFRGMKNRCYNPNDKDYRWYGAKGIKIVDEWINNPELFEDWSIENGYNDNLTIDRIDSDKDYCPENCRWIVLNNNSKYKSTTSLIEVDGEVHTGRDWAKELNLGANIINTYIRKYGLENTIEFIRKFRDNPELKIKVKSNQSYYDLYMNSK